MIVTQNYSGSSNASLEGNKFRLGLATEQNRPPVRLQATIRDGLSYARLMHSLYAVVTGDQRTPKRDRTAYMEWVQQRYLDELAKEQAAAAGKLPALTSQREEVRERIKEATKAIAGYTNMANSGDFYKAKRKYFDYLYTQDREAWIILDPVVSVHPDCVIFEAFSKDESSYGRVTIPMSGLEVRTDTAVDYGTTNIDFSPDLNREIARIRSYRSTDLEVGAGGVGLATSAGSVIERKIDLPPSWVRGFLQVQSAATLPGHDVRLSAATVAEVLSALKRKREDAGPRSLRFVLKPQQKPQIIIEPWNIVIAEHSYIYEGSQIEEVRVWGRRRLLILESLLPHASHVTVRLLGTGMPSYWSVFLQESRFDLGVSGWTQNDWSRAAQFDLLASTSQHARNLKPHLATVEKALQAKLFATPSEIAEAVSLSRDEATAVLQNLCREGRAMYDHVSGTYRWRQLFPFMSESEILEDPRLKAAQRLLTNKGVKWTAEPLKNPPPISFADKPANAPTWRKFVFQNAASHKFWNILLKEDTHTVHFGKVGTDGQKQVKEFDNETQAEASYNKLIKEKTGKGYKEVTPIRKATPVVNSEATTPDNSDKIRFQAEVQGESGKNFEVVIDLDSDGRVAYAHCTCGTFRRDKLRKGPCVHILAATLFSARQLVNNN